jgi:hypothetical protein
LRKKIEKEIKAGCVAPKFIEMIEEVRYVRFREISKEQAEETIENILEGNESSRFSMSFSQQDIP